MWLWLSKMPTQNFLMLLALLMLMLRSGTCWPQFGRDFEPEYLSRYWRWSFVKILKQIFRQDFESEFWSKFWSWSFVKILRLNLGWELKSSLNMKFDRDLKLFKSSVCWWWLLELLLNPRVCCAFSNVFLSIKAWRKTFIQRIWGNWWLNHGLMLRSAQHMGVLKILLLTVNVVVTLSFKIIRMHWRSQSMTNHHMNCVSCLVFLCSVYTTARLLVCHVATTLDKTR